MVESKTAEKFDVKAIAAQLTVPSFYVSMKIGRLGEDKEGIIASIQEDLAAIKKIAKDLSLDEKTVKGEFIKQMASYRSEARKIQGQGSLEEVILRGLRALLEERWVGQHPRISIVLEIGKTQKSSRNSSFRWMAFLVETDQPGKAWELVRAIHWGPVPGVKSGMAAHVAIENSGGFKTVKEIEAADEKQLPAVIPGDPRYRVRLISTSQTITRSGIKNEGEVNEKSWEIHTCYLTLLVEQPDGSSTIIEGSSLSPDRWHEAPHDKILNTLIVQTQTEKGLYYNISDWQLSRDQENIPMPDLPVLIDLSDENFMNYLDDMVILEGQPTSLELKEGEKGPFYVMGLVYPFNKTGTSLIMRDNVDIGEGVIEDNASTGAQIFCAAKVRVLAKVGIYLNESTGKQRVSRQALSIWSMDVQDIENLEDLPEEPLVEELDQAAAETVGEILEEILEDNSGSTSENENPEENPEEDLLISQIAEAIVAGEITENQAEGVEAGIITLEEAKRVTEVLKESRKEKKASKPRAKAKPAPIPELEPIPEPESESQAIAQPAGESVQEIEELDITTENGGGIVNSPAKLKPSTLEVRKKAPIKQIDLSGLEKVQPAEAKIEVPAPAAQGVQSKPPLGKGRTTQSEADRIAEVRRRLQAAKVPKETAL